MLESLVVYILIGDGANTLLAYIKQHAMFSYKEALCYCTIAGRPTIVAM